MEGQLEPAKKEVRPMQGKKSAATKSSRKNHTGILHSKSMEAPLKKKSKQRARQPSKQASELVRDRHAKSLDSSHVSSGLGS